LKMGSPPEFSGGLFLIFFQKALLIFVFFKGFPCCPDCQYSILTDFLLKNNEKAILCKFV